MCALALSLLPSAGVFAQSPDSVPTARARRAPVFTLYFENDKFGARVSFAERDDYLTSIPGRNGTYVERTEGTSNIDFSANYNFSDSLKLTFEALNLTDESENQRLDATVAPANVVSYFHETGRQFFVGLRYTL